MGEKVSTIHIYVDCRNDFRLEYLKPFLAQVTLSSLKIVLFLEVLRHYILLPFDTFLDRLTRKAK